MRRLRSIIFPEKPNPTELYPDALKRNPKEGGYTFLHRVFRQAMDSGLPVVVNVGDIYLQYQYDARHKTFVQGLKVLSGKKSSQMYKRFLGVARDFSLDKAKEEGGYL